MSISTSNRVMENKHLFERMLIAVCTKHGIARSDFLQAERDQFSNRIRLAFKPAQYDVETLNLARNVLARLNAEFVGEVTRAAVPELSKDAADLAQRIINPQNRIIYVDERAVINDGI